MGRNMRSPRPWRSGWPTFIGTTGTRTIWPRPGSAGRTSRWFAQLSAKAGIPCPRARVSRWPSSPGWRHWRRVGGSPPRLRYKLQPEHLHLQAQGLLHISRTVQWIREAACLPAASLRREAEEVVLTGIFLSTFSVWLHDASPEAGRTQAWLDRRPKNSCEPQFCTVMHQAHRRIRVLTEMGFTRYRKATLASSGSI